MHSDFESLYRALGLTPDCDVVAFRQAYRKRLSALHPDKGGAAPEREPLDFHELQTLYKRAIDFHDRYGRLPGTTAAATRVSGDAWPAAPAAPAAAAATSPPHARAGSSAARETPSAWRWVLPVVFAVAAIFMLVWSTQPSVQPVQTTTAWSGAIATAAQNASPAITTQSAVTDTPAPRPRLHAGMTAEQARQLLGEPAIQESHYWWYGPSWVRFDDGRVESWYSSPLRPLRALPQDDDDTLPDASFDPSTPTPDRD